MKILYIVHDYWPDHLAGTENYTHYIAHEMAKLGHEVFVFTAEKEYKGDYSVERYIEEDSCLRRNDKVGNNKECGNDMKPPLGPLLKKEGRQWWGVNVIKVHKQDVNARSLNDSYEDDEIRDIFVNILDEIKPDVVHVQHLWRLSVDIVDYIKSKNIPVLYTIHDLWLECFNINRLTTDENKLCTGASIDKCSKCYKMARFMKKQNILDKMYLKASRVSGYDKNIKKTILEKRNKKMQELIHNVDLFISPSEYLKNEFINFGIPEEKIIYSRNGMNIGHCDSEVMDQVRDDKGCKNGIKPPLNPLLKKEGRQQCGASGMKTQLSYSLEKEGRQQCGASGMKTQLSYSLEKDCRQRCGVIDSHLCGNDNVGENNKYKNEGENGSDDGCYNERVRFANDNKCGDARNDGDVVRFVFTSHIKKLKGIDVLMDACEILEKRNVNNIGIELYGKLGKNEKYNEAFLKNVEKLQNVSYEGEFVNTDIHDILVGIDYLILPSIWPENAPLVIDEAYLNNMPCIVSNIGGMAERVDDGVNGLHFEVGNAEDLADKIEYVVNNRELKEKFIKNIPHVKTISENAVELEKIYKSMI